MNKLQKEYAVAKALVDSIKEASDRAEYEYCKSNNYLTESGKVAERVWMIDDEEVFEIANSGYTNPYFDDMKQAEAALKTTEDALIEWSLSIMPTGLSKERDALRSQASKNRKVRKQMIDLAFRLDARTLPKGLQRA